MLVLCVPAQAAEDVDTGSSPLAASGAVALGVFGIVTVSGAATTMAGASLADASERNTPRIVQLSVLGAGVAMTGVGLLGMLGGASLIGLEALFAE